MKTALLDLNVLTALLWPAHEHHDAAHRWFHARRSARWASCPLTQLGFVRIASNPAFSRDALSPLDATTLLADNLSHAAHEFWPDSLQLTAVLKAIESGLRGHKQVTDAYLLALSERHKGVLATFDRGLRSLAGDTLGSALEVVATR